MKTDSFAIFMNSEIHEDRKNDFTIADSAFIKTANLWLKWKLTDQQQEIFGADSE